MRVAHRLWNIYYCCAEFIKAHKTRLIILAAVFVIACALGVRSGCAGDAAEALSERSPYMYLADAQSRSIAGYLFLTLVGFLLCLVLLCALGCNFYSSLVGVLVFFYVSYMMGYSVALYLNCFKLAALPYIIIVYIPYCLLSSFALACAVSLSVSCGIRMRRNGCFCIDVIRECIPTYAVLAVATAVSVVYASIFGGIFTAGLIV